MESCGICYETNDGVIPCDSCKFKICEKCIEEWSKRSCECPICKNVCDFLLNTKEYMMYICNDEIVEEDSSDNFPIEPLPVSPLQIPVPIPIPFETIVPVVPVVPIELD